MSLRRDVTSAARAAVAALPVGFVDAAEDALDEAATGWHHATEGSHDDDVPRVHAAFEAAKDGVRSVRQMLRQIPGRVESWITGLGGTALVDTSAVTDTGQAAVPMAVAAAFEDLPPPVPKRRPGQTQMPTHGRILDAHGTVVGRLRSGTDETTPEANKLITDAGFPALAIAVHVELKALVRMRSAGQHHTTVLINNLPCPGLLGCDTVLPRLLRPGETLTVYGPQGYRKTFRRMTP